MIAQIPVDNHSMATINSTTRITSDGNKTGIATYPKPARASCTGVHHTGISIPSLKNMNLDDIPIKIATKMWSNSVKTAKPSNKRKNARMITLRNSKNTAVKLGTSSSWVMTNPS